MNGFLQVRNCAAPYPDKCSSKNWELFHEKEKTWEPNQLVHVDCGKNDSIRISGLLIKSIILYISEVSFHDLFSSIKEYSDVLIPSSSGCPENTRGCEEFSCPRTCYCEDHCSWERCTLSEPPQKCLHGTNAEWKWDLRWWSAKYIGQYKMIYIKINAISDDILLYLYTSAP